MLYGLEMRTNKTPGLLITFCGLDGCGKTTMIDKLTDDLNKKYPLFITKQPTEFVRQTQIFRTYMDSPKHESYDYRSLSLLAASDRVQHVNKVIVPQMEQGKIVISDRYFYSCLANLRARGYKQDKWIYEISRSIIKPDIAFFLDIPVYKAISRVRSRPDEKESYIDMALQERLREEYLLICETNDCVLVSTDCSEAESYDKVKKSVEGVLCRYEYNKRHY